GGFVLAALYDYPRPTGDLDYIDIMPAEESATLQTLAGEGSPLHRKHRIRVQRVTVAEISENYAERLIEVLPRAFSKLRLLALEPHDLALSKLTRNSPVDREDVRFLTQRGLLNRKTFQERYRTELRPALANETRHDRTLALWLEAFWGQKPS